MMEEIDGDFKKKIASYIPRKNTNFKIEFGHFFEKTKEIRAKFGNFMKNSRFRQFFPSGVKTTLFLEHFKPLLASFSDL